MGAKVFLLQGRILPHIGKEYATRHRREGWRRIGGIGVAERRFIRKMGRAWVTKVTAGVGGLAAAMLSLGASLYQQRQADIIPQVEIATPVEAGRWTVSVLHSSIGTTLPNGSPVSAGKKALAVDMILENISAESSNLYGDLIALPGIIDLPKPEFYLTRDHAILWDLQPLMPEAVTAVWEVPATLELPKTLQLRIEGALFKPRDNLYAAPGWFPAGSVAQMNLPITNAPAGAKP